MHIVKKVKKKVKLQLNNLQRIGYIREIFKCQRVINVEQFWNISIAISKGHIVEANILSLYQTKHLGKY